MEEDYTNTVRGMYISGIFDNFDGDETAELPNCADVLGMDIEIDGKRFSLCEGEMISYSRYLDIRNAELVRKCVWKPLGKGRVTLEFRRIVSKKRLHSLAQTVKIMPEDTGMDVRIITEINGRMTNSGVQHFSEIEKRVRDGKILQYMQRTLQSHVTVIYNMGFRYFVTEGEKMCCLYPKTEIRTLRRKIELSAEVRLKKGQTFLLEKIVDVQTSRDKKSVGESISEIAQKSMEAVQENLRLGYNRLRDEHVSAWEANLWNRCIGKIFGGSEEEKRAFDYALYQLYAMVPAHDDRMRLAAKGLSGEGDKGHVFWDTEIFALPCYIFTCPEIAQNLLLYRYRCLEVAKKKAAEYGYRGVQYPWESAWFTDGEETPKLGDPDLNTGKRDKVWTGLI